MILPKNYHNDTNMKQHTESIIKERQTQEGDRRKVDGEGGQIGKEK